jgi:tetratricopeptide (TPR) repeat protein
MSRLRFRLTLLAVGAAAVVAPAQPPASPPLDAEAAAPGLWRVVVQTTPHPLITPAFRDRLRRDLLAALPAAAHPVATVEVVDLAEVPRASWEPLWQQVEAKGLAALDTPRDLTGVTTSVLRVEVRDGAYHLEARLYDGFAGLAAPPVRRQSVRTPELVGRSAGLLVGRDFGPAGTVEPVEGNPDAARVRFRAGTAGPLDRLVAVGDVFAVSRVTRTSRTAPTQKRTATGKLIEPPPGSVPPPVLSAAAREYTYLRVTEAPKDGVAVCAVFSPFKTPFPKDAASYRCLKLATVRSAVAVRLVNPAADGAKEPPTRAATVRATDRGFFPGAPDRREFFDYADGVYKSSGPLDGLACVTVALGATREARFPVPVFGPEPVGLPFSVDAKAEEKAAYERAVLGVSGRVGEARHAQNAGFDAISKLIQARRNPEALARAKAAMASAEATAGAVTEEVQTLRGRPDRPPGADELLATVDRQVQALRQNNGQLATRVKELEAIVERESSPGAVARELQAKAVNVEIKALLENGEVDEALRAYDQLLTLVENNPEVKGRRDALAAEWKTKSEDHAKAREYLSKTWPAAATAADLKDSLPRVRSAVDTLKAVGDRHGLRRFARHLAGFPARVEELSRGLENNPTDLAALREAAGVLNRVDQEISEFLRKGG